MQVQPLDDVAAAVTVDGGGYLHELPAQAQGAAEQANLQVAPSAARPAPSSEAEREMVTRALERSGFNITRTAQALNVSRVTFYRMLRRNGLALRQELVSWSGGTA
jgi:transcriptional regulator of acetoin/glycerol metabolism